MIRGRTSMMLALALILSLPVRADDPPASIAEALQQPVEANWEQVPLGEVLGRFAAQQNCNLVLREAALQDAGINLAELPVGASLGEATWQSALRFLLRQNSLEMIADEDSNLLIVTTVSDARERFTVRAYSLEGLRELLDQSATSDQLATALTPVQPWGVWSEAIAMECQTGTWNVADFQHSLTGPLTQLLEALPELEWKEGDGEGGSATIQGNLLLVRQTAHGHEWIKALLDGLNEIASGEGISPTSVRVLRDSERSERSAAIAARLDEHGNWPAEAMTLQEGLARLRTDMGVSLWIDSPALTDAGISLEEEIPPVSLRDVSWQVIVDALLGQRQLKAVVDQDHLLITTTDVASNLMECRLYNIAGLNLEGEGFAKLSRLTQGQWLSADGEGGRYVVLANRLLLVVQPADVQAQVEELLELLRSQPEEPAPEPSFVLRLYRAPSPDQVEDLQLALRQLIAADWPDDAIQRIGSTLAIRQTAAVHRRIEALMTALQQVTPQAPHPESNAKPEPVEQPARSGIMGGGGGFFQRPVESGEQPN